MKNLAVEKEKQGSVWQWYTVVVGYVHDLQP